MKTYDEIPSDKDRGSIVLIVDDDKGSHKRIQFLCRNKSFTKNVRFLSAFDLKEARKLLHEYKPVQVMLLDKHLSWEERDDNQNGIEAIPEFLEDQPQLEILVITSSKRTEDCVDAIRYGASDYVTKDEESPIITRKIERAIEMANLKLQNARLEGSRPAPDTINLAGSTGAMQAYRKALSAVAATDDTVLLLGKSGMGKTAGAKEIHRHRQEFLKQDGPFMEINMATIPEDLAEKLLFGNEKGAYTGADKINLGYFELANRGTLFLDEIGEMPLLLQAKLLKAIEEKKIIRLGGDRERSFNAKIICATNRDLKQMVSEGKFREDLFYRINPLTIHVPSLAERKEDIPDIVRALLPQCRTSSNKAVHFEDLPPSLLHFLKENSWENGGIREIRNTLKKISVFSPEDRRGRPIMKKWKEILKQDGSFTSALKEGPISIKEVSERGFDLQGNDFHGYHDFIEFISNRVIVDAVQSAGKRTRAASLLKVSYNTLTSIIHRKMDEKNRHLLDKPKAGPLSLKSDSDENISDYEMPLQSGGRV